MALSVKSGSHARQPGGTPTIRRRHQSRGGPVIEHEITLVNDGDGIALLGDAAAIDRYLESEDLPSTDLGLAKLGNVMGAGGAVAQVGSQVAESSGRWVRLTEQSAKALATGTTMKGSAEGVSRAILVDPGTKRTKMVLEFTRTPGSVLTNPAMLSGVAGLMTQLAMQQTMQEITDYLATIDAKLDDVLRNQKDAVVAEMIGVGLVVDEAMTIRAEVGRVSEVTWSKVQGSQATIFSTQGYALRQIDGLTSKLEKQTKVGDLADVSRELRAGIDEWLAILARCCQLQDAIAVLELDRVLDASPDELDRHRRGLRKARQDRLDLLSRTTGRLLSRADSAAGQANAEILLNPFDSKALFASSQQIAGAVVVFNERLGIESGHAETEARRWGQAVGETRDQIVDAGAKGFEGAKRLGGESAGRVRARAGRISGGIGARALRARERLRRENDPEPDETD